MTDITLQWYPCLWQLYTDWEVCKLAIGLQSQHVMRNSLGPMVSLADECVTGLLLCSIETLDLRQDCNIMWPWALSYVVWVAEFDMHIPDRTQACPFSFNRPSISMMTSYFFRGHHFYFMFLMFAIEDNASRPMVVEGFVNIFKYCDVRCYHLRLAAQGN